MSSEATEWFTHCRLVGNAVLEIHLDSFERIGEPEFIDLCQSFAVIDGVIGVLPRFTSRETLQLITRGEFSEDDHKRVAIAASYLIEEAIVETELRL